MTTAKQVDLTLDEIADIRMMLKDRIMYATGKDAAKIHTLLDKLVRAEFRGQ